MAKLPAKPDDDRTARVETTASRVRLTRGTLLVLDGEDGGRKVSLESGTLTIGSEAACDLRLSERTVSKRHAELSVVGGQFVLRDLASTNGTFLNGSRVKEAYLSPGDLVRLGNCALRFEPSQEEVRVPPSPHDRFGPLFGRSAVMRQVFGVLERVAQTDATVLLTGETGTGKDLVAHAVHDASRRARKPFVAFDCSSVSPDVVASELFGHMEGAFTGALKRRAGAFEAATGGTIFLDEVGELTPDLQPKLLRVLEAREVRPVGANAPIPVDVRVLAATHRDLEAMVEKGTFREDLFYRLAVVRVDLPPLRERREDLDGLIRSLLERMRHPGGTPSVTDDAVAALASLSWPGNVRELRNVLERTLALAPSPRIEARDLLVQPSERAQPPAGFDPTGRTLEEIEREVIRRTLDRTGNQREAARLLGIHRNTLREKIKRYGLSSRDPEGETES